MKRFETPKKTLGTLDPEAAGNLIAAAADVALIVDGDGVIRDVAFGSEDFSREGCADWIGQPWSATVTVESRPKVEALLREAASKVPPRARHVNHPSPRGIDVPVMYSAVQVGRNGRVVAVGRDLRSVAALQQRLIEAQQSLERDYWRFRQVETRYRLLFQRASEAVLIVDASTFKVVEANPAAGQLLGETARGVVGRGVLENFDADSAQAIQTLLACVRAATLADDLRVRLADSGRELMLSASMFRQDNVSLFLIRLSAVGEGVMPGATPKHESVLLQVVDSAPDAFVVTDPKGRVLTANRAFVELVQSTSEAQVRGESIERWLGRSGVDLSVLTANLRQHGSVRLFATVVRAENGDTTEVEVSAVSVPHASEPCLGYVIRNVGWRPATDSHAGRAAPRSVEQLTKLVGRVPLRDLVRESTDLIEKLCIEAALELTRDNRASAAEMLGVSRQSLYVKLRRYGMVADDGDSET